MEEGTWLILPNGKPRCSVLYPVEVLHCFLLAFIDVTLNPLAEKSNAVSWRPHRTVFFL